MSFTKLDSELRSVRSQFVSASKQLNHENRLQIIKEHQVDFCYYVDEFDRGPEYRKAKMISKIHELVSSLRSLTTK